MIKNRFLILLSLLAWLIGIFYLSHQPDLRVIPLLNQFNLLKGSYAFLLNHERALELVLRKALHMLEYFILTILLYTFFKSSSIYLFNKLSILLTTISSFLLAVLDELHQYFVPGRDGKLMDVFIDSIGIASAIFLIVIINLLIYLNQMQNIKSTKTD